MDIDKVYNLFFSPTDTTKFVLQFLSEQISPNYKKYKFNIKRYKSR